MTVEKRPNMNLLLTINQTIKEMKIVSNSGSVLEDGDGMTTNVIHAVMLFVNLQKEVRNFYGKHLNQFKHLN